MSQTLSLRTVLSSIRELRKQVAESQVAVDESSQQKKALDFLDELDEKVRTFCFRDEEGESTLEFLRLNQ